MTSRYIFEMYKSLCILITVLSVIKAKVLVLGGSGFVGSKLISLLSLRGVDVVSAFSAWSA